MRPIILLLAIAALTVGAWATMGGYDGPPRWEATTLTVSPDLAAAVDAWGGGPVTLAVAPAAEADITTTSGGTRAAHVGGEARRTLSGGYITACSITLAAGAPEAVVIHEVGHCLGLAHNSGRSGGSVMHWFAEDYEGGWSDTVTDLDRAELAAIYKEQP